MIDHDTTYDVMVIGAGFAGMAATLFAAKRGLSVVQTGATGGIDFSTGFIDLMGVHPVEEGKRWRNPWDAIKAVSADLPDHPYARIGAGGIAEAIDLFTAFLAENGLEYVGHVDRNSCALTPAGTVKRTWRLPKTAWAGVMALEEKAPTLIVDFHGLKGFSGRQLVETRKHHWPNLKTVRVNFPAGHGELYPEHMAWALADRGVREKLAAEIASHAADVEYVGFPAILGLTDPQSVVAEMEMLIGKKVFEIPTMPPSIAGPRLRAVFDRGLPLLGVRTLSQKLVTGVETEGDGFRFTVGQGAAETEVSAKAAILASGRFFGKGMKADRQRMSEAVFGLPVVQPDGRDGWHRHDFFDAKGHPAGSAGIEVDDTFRPLGPDGKPAYDNLHAAGAILAHQDWMRMKCGAGLAIATAFKAVQSLSG